MSGRLPLLILVTLLPSIHGWGRSPPNQPAAEVVPRFSVVPGQHAKEGQTQMQTLERSAGTETFLDRMLGTNCYTRAVADLRQDCQRMDQEQKSRLALRLTNCQLATQGQGTYPCADTEQLRKCVDRLPDRDNVMYIEFLTHADSMCLFIQNQEFEKYTETMLNRLSEGAGFAREQLVAITTRTERLGADAARIVASSEEALERLREQRELQLAASDAMRQHRAEAERNHASLAASQAAALDLGRQQLEQAREIEATASAVAAQVASGQTKVEQLFAAIDQQAGAVAAAQAEAAQAQQQLRGQLRALSDGSQGLRSAVDAVAEYQRRSDAALIKLLGRSYTLEDAAFYAVGAVAALAAGASRATQGVRLPLLALLGASLVGERLLLDRLHPWLDVDASGNIVVPLHLPAWLPFSMADGSPVVIDFKWAVRRGCMAVGAVLVLGALWAYRNYERANHGLLLEILQEQRKRETEAERAHKELVQQIRQCRIDHLTAMSSNQGQAKGRRVQPVEQPGLGGEATVAAEQIEYAMHAVHPSPQAHALEGPAGGSGEVPRALLLPAPPAAPPLRTPAEQETTGAGGGSKYLPRKRTVSSVEGTSAAAGSTQGTRSRRRAAGASAAEAAAAAAGAGKATGRGKRSASALADTPAAAEGKRRRKGVDMS